MPLVELTALAAGAVLLLAARGRRVKVRRQKRRMLRRALCSPDPAVRRAAIQVTGDDGLSRAAGVLLDLVRRERDASVLLVLAQVVVRNQWEPANHPGMVQLRLWAHRYLDETSDQNGERRRQGFQGLSAAEVVNLMIQPANRPDHAGRRSGRRLWD